MRARRALAGLLGLLACALTMAASAHAVLVTSSPADGSRVDAEPAAVRLRFDEPVGLIPAAAEVISGLGRRADTGHPRLAGGGTTIVLPLRRGLPAGTYSAVWRVVSADTHVVSGSITFGLRVRPGAGVAAPASRTGSLDLAAGAAQGLGYGGIVLLVGVAAAVRLIWAGAAGSRRARALARVGWAALAAGTIAEFLLQGPLADNAGWGAVIALRGFAQTGASAYGQQLLARLALLLVLSPLVARGAAVRPARSGRPGRARDAGLAAAGLAVLASVAVTGHEAVGPGAWLALPSAIAHLAAMSLWLGGLAVLAAVILPALRRDGDPAAAAPLRRWSVIAYSCVVVLAVTGEYQASRQVSPVPALWSTRYGIILLVKIAIVAVMLAAAAAAQRQVARLPAAPPAGSQVPAESQEPARSQVPAGSQVPAAGRAPADDGPGWPAVPPLGPGAARAITRGVGIELAAAAAVLGVTAALVAQPPARTTYGPAAALTAPLGPDHVTVRVSPTRRGPEAFDIRVLNAAGVPVPATTLTATLSSPSVASLAVPLRRAGAGGSRWASTAAVVPLPGVWTLILNVGLGPATAYTTSVSYRAW